MSKATEFREMSDEQLAAELQQTQRDLFDLRFRASTEKLDSPSNIKRLRRNIARIKTIQSERQPAVQ
ncbi:MAG: 50S ribosomal protein L29 [Planctomycetaceae bacterium]|nr:50S ribosomal protein L29 [Planctomycetaceae bacterium]